MPTICGMPILHEETELNQIDVTVIVRQRYGVSRGTPGQSVKSPLSTLQFLTFVMECPFPLRAPSCRHHSR